MPDYIFLIHNDADDGGTEWAPYLARLRESGHFEGGSAIGDGACVRKTGAAPPLSAHLVGYLRVSANNFEHAKSMLAGNPHFEAGGTVEVRELPRTD
jgi:hypothetical protein